MVIGAGPAGLTAAYQLGKAGHPCTVLEGTDVVGGISQTVVRDGYRFDIGGHRFFTKVPEVEALWHEILPDEDFMQRPRSSRIYYQGKFFDYPLKAFSALRTLGPVEAIRCGLSFLWVRVHPPKDQTTLEGYVAANYGWRLYGHFFKAYSTKVWAVPPSKISAEWGAQRIKGMTLWTAVWEPFRARFAGKRGKGQQVTSLIEEFQYPKHGPGMMWERCQTLVEGQGSKVVFEAPVTQDHPCRRTGHRSGRRWLHLRRRPRHLVDAVQRLAQGDGPAGSRRGAARGRRPGVPRLPVRRPRRARRDGGLDRQLDLHPRSRDQDHARAELRLLVAAHGRATAATSSGSSTPCRRATSGGPRRTRTWSRRARPSSKRSGS